MHCNCIKMVTATTLMSALHILARRVSHRVCLGLLSSSLSRPTDIAQQWKPGCVVRFESRIHCCLNHAHSWRQQWNAANASGKQVQSRLTVQRTAVRASHAVQPCCRAQYSRAVARSSRRSAAIASSISYACIDAYSCKCTVCGTWSVCATADACGTNCHTLMPV